MSSTQQLILLTLFIIRSVSSDLTDFIRAPTALNARTRDTLIRTNPFLYFAPYFGYKAHFYQNEKKLLKTYVHGCSHVLFAALVVPDSSLSSANIAPLRLIRSDQDGSWPRVLLLPIRARTYKRISVSQRQNTMASNTVHKELHKIKERMWPELNHRLLSY